MNEDMILQCGLLRPLSRNDVILLNVSLDGFEEECDLVLAPYILNAPFLDRLQSKADVISDSPGSDSEWLTMWAVIPDDETVIGILDFAAEPDTGGTVEMRWTFNPEWLDSDLAREAIRIFVESAFGRENCRIVRKADDDTVPPEMAKILREMGFLRKTAADGSSFFRLSKAIEGRLL